MKGFETTLTKLLEDLCKSRAGSTANIKYEVANQGSLGARLGMTAEQAFAKSLAGMSIYPADAHLNGKTRKLAMYRVKQSPKPPYNNSAKWGMVFAFQMFTLDNGLPCTGRIFIGFIPSPSVLQSDVHLHCLDR